MNNKITIQDLADQISVLSGQSKKLSEAFLRALTEIVEDSLEKDGIAKVKGIGTFKIIAIEERKSVNVTDGSTVIIPAHKKITFTPEKELKEAVNKPYEHLETYVLPNDGPVDAPESDDDETYVDEELNLSVDQTMVHSTSQTEQTITEENITKAAEQVHPNPIYSEPIASNVSLEAEREQTIPAQNTAEATEPTQQVPAYSEPNASGISSSTPNEQSVSTPKAVFEEPTITTEGLYNNQLDENIEEVGKAENNTQQEQTAEVSEKVSLNETKEETETANEFKETTEPTVTSEAQVEGNSVTAEPSDMPMSGEESSSEKQDTETVNETEDSEKITNPEGEPVQEQKEPEKANEPSSGIPENPNKGGKDEHEKKGKKNLLFVIILLIILIVICVLIGLNKSPYFRSQMEGIKEQVTNILGIEQKKEEVVPLHPTPKPQEEEFFEEKKEDMYEAAQADPEFPEIVVEEEQNYDWFEEDFKKFLSKEYPKIHFEVTGEPIIDTIKSGKTLTSMSRKYYNGCKDFWVYIYLYNKDVIKRPDDVPAGTVIKIPQLDQSVVNPESYESVNAAKDVKETYLRLFN